MIIFIQTRNNSYLKIPSSIATSTSRLCIREDETGLHGADGVPLVAWSKLDDIDADMLKIIVKQPTNGLLHTHVIESHIIVKNLTNH